MADAESGDVLDARAIDRVRQHRRHRHRQRHPGRQIDRVRRRGLDRVPVRGGAGGACASTFTDVNGAFVLTNPGTAAIDVTSPIGGQFFDVTNFVGFGESLTSSVLPPGPVSFVHNAANTDQLVVAQANGYANANQVRRFLLGYLPTYPTISSQTNMPVTSTTERRFLSRQRLVRPEHPDDQLLPGVHPVRQHVVRQRQPARVRPPHRADGRQRPGRIRRRDGGHDRRAARGRSRPGLRILPQPVHDAAAQRGQHLPVPRPPAVPAAAARFTTAAS